MKRKSQKVKFEEMTDEDLLKTKGGDKQEGDTSKIEPLPPDSMQQDTVSADSLAEQ